MPAREAMELQALRQRRARKEKHRKDVIEKARKEFEAKQRRHELERRQFFSKYARYMRAGNFEGVYDMIDNHGVDPNWEDTYGNTALIYASRWGRKARVRTSWLEVLI